MDLGEYWQCLDRADWDRLASFYHPGAVIRWHNSDEQFTREEFVRVNREYPLAWRVRLERAETDGETLVSVCRVSSPGSGAAFRVVSLMRLSGGLIMENDEYWGDVGTAPEWRREMGVGRPIAGKRD